MENAPFGLLVLAVAVPFASACSSHSCPHGIDAIVDLPAAQSSPITVVLADPPCSARASTTDGGPGQIQVGFGGAPTCHVRVSLANGDTYAFDVRFGTRNIESCGAIADGYDASIPERIDAGN